MSNSIQIEATDRKGRVHLFSGEPGASLMQILKDQGLPVAATCGGSKSCATCHVYLPEGYDLVGEPDEEESDLLSESDHYREGHSRLSCQIQPTPRATALCVELAPQD